MIDSRLQWAPGPMKSLTPAANLWQFGPRAFRSKQPDPEQIQPLAQFLELTKILDLTDTGEHDRQTEIDACNAVPINSEWVPMNPGPACPTQLQIDRSLVYLGIEMSDEKLVIDPNAPGCLIHCTHGEDRSGVVCACYQLCFRLSLPAVLDDFRRGHIRGYGLWGEYWFVHSILEFSERLKHVPHTL